MERIKVESLLSIYLGRNCMHLSLLVRVTTTFGILGACSSSTKMVTGNPDAMAFGMPLVLTVCICMESGYVLRTTDYGYRQHEREHENLVEQPGTLGLKLTGATPAGAHGHSTHPWPHCAVHNRSYPTRDITNLT